MGLLWFMGDKSAVNFKGSVSNWETGKLGPQAVAIFFRKTRRKNMRNIYGVMSEGTSRAHGLSMIIIFPMVCQFGGYGGS